MKYISNRTLGCLACFLLAACQSEEVTVIGSKNALQVLSVDLENEKNTKAGVTSIKEVMVYATSNTHTEIATNVQSKFIYDASTWSCSTPPELSDNTFYIYAWYPSQRKDGGDHITATNNSEGNHSVPAYVYSEDTFTDQKQDDYLYADQTTQITASKGSKTVRFTMKHALSKVSFEITKDVSATETLTLTRVDIISNTNSLQTGTGQMYLKNGTLIGLSSVGQVSLTGSFTLGNSLSVPNLSALVAPMGKPEKVLSFRLYVSVNGEDRIFETGTVKEDNITDWQGVQWIAGLHYVYRIKVSKVGGIINGVSIYDWQKDTDQNTQVGI